MAGRKNLGSENFGIRLSGDAKQELVRRAQAAGITPTVLARRMLIEMLEKPASEEAKS